MPNWYLTDEGAVDHDITPIDGTGTPPRGCLRKRSGVVDRGDVFSGVTPWERTPTPDPPDLKMRRVGEYGTRRDR